MADRIPNFRDYRALILHPADDNRQILVEQLGRLGLQTRTAWPEAEESGFDPDVVFFDADRRLAGPVRKGFRERSIPLIAILGTEAPGRLESMLDQAPSAMLQKPLRSAGIFRSLVFAFHIHGRLRELESRLDFRDEQIKARSLVFKALLQVMERYRVDDTEAFRAIRAAAMASKLAVEAFCFMLFSDPAPYLRQVETALGRRAEPDDSPAVARAGKASTGS